MKIKKKLLILLTVICASCNFYNRDNVSRYHEIVKDKLGDKLFIPNNLVQYRPFDRSYSDNSEMVNKKFKLYSHIDASCGTCVSFIGKWNKLMPKFNNVSLFLICTSDDNFTLLKYLCESDEVNAFPFTLYLNKDKEFLKQNDFLKVHKHLETILTDTTGKILLLGNPLLSKDLEKVYLEYTINH